MFFVRNPEYGKDYDDGYIFFSYNTDSLISTGIALFTKFEAKSKIPISHCGIVTGKQTCIEAANPGGVQVSNFHEKYLKPKKTVVFLCKPRNVSPELAGLMTDEGLKHVGKSYAIPGVISSAFWNLLGFATIGYLRKKRNWFNSEDRFFCSELVAEALISAYPDRPGCLEYHPTNIYPQTLFEDHIVFEKWNPAQPILRRTSGRIVEECDCDFC